MHIHLNYIANIGRRVIPLSIPLNHLQKICNIFNGFITSSVSVQEKSSIEFKSCRRVNSYTSWRYSLCNYQTPGCFSQESIYFSPFVFSLYIHGSFDICVHLSFKDKWGETALRYGKTRVSKRFSGIEKMRYWQSHFHLFRVWTLHGRGYGTVDEKKRNVGFMVPSRWQTKLSPMEVDILFCLKYIFCTKS